MSLETVEARGPWAHRSVSANGIRLHVAEAGPENGPLVLLLHGFPGFWWSWHAQLPALAAAGHRVVAADLRGYGGSDRPPRGYDLWTLAGDVTGLVRALGARRAAVVGAGWGGAIGWTVAARHPAAVTRLALLGAPHPLALRARPPAGPLRTVLGFQVPRRPERDLRRDGAARVETLLREGSGSAWPRDAGFGEVAARHREAMLVPRASHCTLEYFRWAVRSQLRPDGRRFAQAVDRPVVAPVLQLHGEEDPWTPPALARASAAWCDGERSLRTLPGVGHFPHLEAPQQVTGELLEFLSLGQV